ncbi:hypothetical protein N665_1371s0002 [Sinapis alba]|nr:hypothetical protein N665_1371s0002 [Sinapis alba]
MLRNRSFQQTGERDIRRSHCWRHELRLLFFTVILLTAPPSGSVCSPTTSREGSLAAVALRFMGTSPNDLTRALQLSMELRSQRSSSCFPSSGSETTKVSYVAPFHTYGASVQGSPNPDLNLIKRFSRSSSLTCSSELVSPPVGTIYHLPSDDCCTSSDLQSRFTTIHSLPALTSESKKTKLKWAWPNFLVEATKLITKNLKPSFSEQKIRYITKGMASLVILKIVDGFFKCYNLRLLQYYFFWKNCFVDSPNLVWASPSSSKGENLSQLCLLSMNGDALLGSLLRPCFNLLIGLLPCVAVCSGPEGAIETTSVFLVGEGCPSTSLVTIPQISDLVVKASSTHSNLVLNSLSTSYENLSCLISCSILVYDLLPRGCLILFCLCNS